MLSFHSQPAQIANTQKQRGALLELAYAEGSPGEAASWEEVIFMSQQCS